VSENVLKLIPSSANHIPDEDAIKKAISQIKASFPSLENIKYQWPFGFAQFSIEIRNPLKDIADSELKQLETVLGCSLRIIWAHY
jgi:hypothetical protein